MKLAKGYTIIEIITTLAVAAVLIATAAILWPTIPTISLDATGYQVAGDLYYIQSLAMTLKEKYRVNFGTTSYSLADAGGSPILHPATQSATVSLPANMSFTAKPSGDCIAFNGRGTPLSCSTNLPLAGDALIKIMQSSKEVAITVTHTTGYINVTLL